MSYGLPYQGSKNVIAERIVDALPSGVNFCDCCCGGGAILQAAVLSGKYKSVTGYDINKAIVGLIKATMIDFGTIDYNSFPAVSKAKFYEARERNSTLEDWLIRYTCSFGFKGLEYLWSDARTENKMLLHNAVALPTLEERRGALRELIRKIAKGEISQEDIKNLQHNEQLTNLNRFHEVEKAMQSRITKTKLQVLCGSMFDIPFEKYDVLYFDPPYADTLGYNRQPFSQIMFKALLNVLVQSGKTVFVSEYNAPADGFIEIARFDKTMSLEANKSKSVVEKVFYGGTKEDYEKLPNTSKPLADSGSDTSVHDDTDGGTEPSIPVGSEPSEGGDVPSECAYEDDKQVREAIDNLHDAGHL